MLHSSCNPIIVAHVKKKKANLVSPLPRVPDKSTPVTLYDPKPLFVQEDQFVLPFGLSLSLTGLQLILNVLFLR